MSSTFRLTYVKLPATNLNEGRRADDMQQWVAQHPGFKFGVYAKDRLVRVAPSIALAKREAQPFLRSGQNVRIRDVDDPSRSYWHEESEPEELKEATLLDNLQKQFPSVKRVSDVIMKMDVPALKFALSNAKRIQDPMVDVTIHGRRIVLPTEQAEELVKTYQREFRGLKKYVTSRW